MSLIAVVMFSLGIHSGLLYPRNLTRDFFFVDFKTCSKFFINMRVLLEITKFHLHKSMPGADIIRNAGIF